MRGYFLEIFHNQEIQLEDLEPYFANYHEEDWKYCNDGILLFEDIKLHFINDRSLGFSFRYDEKVKSFYSMQDPSKMNVLVDAGDEMFVPLGSFVTTNTAWIILQEFFEGPQTRPNSIRWLVEDQIDWSVLL